MQMVEVGMGDQHQINRRQVLKPYAGLAEALQNEQPASKIGVNDNILLAHLHEKAGVANKGKPELSVGNQLWLVDVPGARGDRRVPDELRKLAGPTTQRAALECVVEHPWGSQAVKMVCHRLSAFHTGYPQ